MLREFLQDITFVQKVGGDISFSRQELKQFERSEWQAHTTTFFDARRTATIGFVLSPSMVAGVQFRERIASTGHLSKEGVGVTRADRKFDP